MTRSEAEALGAVFGTLHCSEDHSHILVVLGNDAFDAHTEDEVLAKLAEELRCRSESA